MISYNEKALDVAIKATASGTSINALILVKSGLKKTEFYVIGGQQRQDKVTKEYHRYKKALVLKVDTAARTAEPVLEYTTPPEYCAWEDDPSILFKAGHCDGKRLYLCTQTEVMVYTVPDFERICYVTHPYMNDVHHVRPSPTGSLIVTSTGLDCVLEFDWDGKRLNEWGVLGKSTWERFSRDVDYRKMVTTKPHEAHPNFTFFLDGELWVTRLEQRDAVCLTSSRPAINITIQEPHDGVVAGNRIYFTTVDGNLLSFDTRTLQQVSCYDLNAISHKHTALGWCRGIHVVDEFRCIIGFSRLRPTKWREKVHWVKYKLSLTEELPEEPTRIALYDFSRNIMEWEFNLEEFGIGEIFSILEAPG